MNWPKKWLLVLLSKINLVVWHIGGGPQRSNQKSNSHYDLDYEQAPTDPKAVPVQKKSGRPSVSTISNQQHQHTEKSMLLSSDDELQ
jgi:hypothetical protein